MTVFPSLRDTVRRGAAIFPGQQGHSQGLSQAVSFPADDFSEKRFVLFFFNSGLIIFRPYRILLVVLVPLSGVLTAILT